MPVRTRGAAALAFALVLPGAATAQELAFTIGWGDDDTTAYRVGLGEDFVHWSREGAWQWTAAWRAELGYWESDDARGDAGDDLWEVGFTPLLRLERTAPGAWAPYLEAGIGGHLLSDTRIGQRELATAWQFGSHLGAGVRLGSHAHVGYRFQHLSNASIKQPNDGIDFHQLVLDWAY